MTGAHRADPDSSAHRRRSALSGRADSARAVSESGARRVPESYRLRRRASNENVNTLPRPGVLSTTTSPCIKRAKLRLMANPSPVPVRTVASAWSNASKILPRFRGSIPGPVSSTAIATTCRSAASRRELVRTATRPVAVNLTALLSRLMSTWRTLPASPDQHARQMRILLEREFEAFTLGQLPEHPLHVVQQRAEIERLGRARVARPASIFDISRMSLINVSK